MKQFQDQIEKDDSPDSLNKKTLAFILLSLFVLTVAFSLIFVFARNRKNNKATPLFQTSKDSNLALSDNQAKESQPKAKIQTISNKKIFAEFLALNKEKNILSARMPEGHVKEISLDDSISFFNALQGENGPQKASLAEFSDAISQNIAGDKTPMNPDISLAIEFKTYKTLTNGEVPASEVNSITLLPIEVHLTTEQRQEIQVQIKQLQEILEKDNSQK